MEVEMYTITRQAQDPADSRTFMRHNHASSLLVEIQLTPADSLSNAVIRYNQAHYTSRNPTVVTHYHTSAEAAAASQASNASPNTAEGEGEGDRAGGLLLPLACTEESAAAVSPPISAIESELERGRCCCCCCGRS